jgi:hypothetical protein
MVTHKPQSEHSKKTWLCWGRQQHDLLISKQERKQDERTTIAVKTRPINNKTMGNSTSCLCNADKDVQEERGQLHLLYSKKSYSKFPVRYQEHHVHQPTRLVVQKDTEGGSHIYAVRHVVEQRPLPYKEIEEEPPPVLNPAELFSPSYMAHTPRVSGMFFIAMMLSVARSISRL